MANTVFALNTASGKVAEVPAVYLTLPNLKDYLVEVPAGTKSYEPTKYKGQTAAEYKASRRKPAAQEAPVEKPAVEVKVEKP